MAEEKRLIGSDGSLKFVQISPKVTVTLSTDLITGNVFAVNINGQALSVTWGTSHVATMGALVTAINANATIVALGIFASQSGQVLTLVSPVTTKPVTYITVSSATVTGGVSQPTVTIATVQGATTSFIPPKSWCKIAAADATWGSGLAVGDFYYNSLATEKTLSGSNCYPCGLKTAIDISGWSLNINADEVETTVMADKYKKYRVGKLDADGTVKFVFIRGESDLPGGIANQFFDVATISSTGVVTFNAKGTTPLYLLGYLDESTASGDVFDATLMRVQFFNFSLPMNMSEAVTMEPKFRLTGDDDPILYRVTLA